MSERKVLNKYFPPDFDPAKIPRRKMPKDRQYKVRLMAPFNMRCLTCQEYIYKGRKFNAVKETVEGEDYLGLHIFRFYIRCTKCCSEIAFKTDPKNTDYVCEIGATRNFNHWVIRDKDAEDAAEAAVEELENNPMLALEKRTEESRQEMDILDALEEIKDANARGAKVSLDSVLEQRQAEREAEQQRWLSSIEDEDEALTKAVFANRVKRLHDSDDEGGEGKDSEDDGNDDGNERGEGAAGEAGPARATNVLVAEENVSKRSKTSESTAQKAAVPSSSSTAPANSKEKASDISIGKLGSKSGLAGLVRPKTAAAATTAASATAPSAAKSVAAPAPVAATSKPPAANTNGSSSGGGGLGGLVAYGSSSEDEA
eukprot:m.69903 g.69903  ORF g.69903 m.69903 type:complete len:371 (-) comp14274_c1_seq1:168-1280(-)